MAECLRQIVPDGPALDSFKAQFCGWKDGWIKAWTDMLIER